MAASMTRLDQFLMAIGRVHEGLEPAHMVQA